MHLENALFGRNCFRTTLAHSWMCPLGEWKGSPSLAFTSPKSFETKLTTPGAPSASVLCGGASFEGSQGKGDISGSPGALQPRSGHVEVPSSHSLSHLCFQMKFKTHTRVCDIY